MIFRTTTNFTTSKEPKSPKVLHHNAAAGIQSKMHAYRHPTVRQATGPGRFVYKPKQSLPLPLNNSKHWESSAPIVAAPPQVRTSKPSEADYLGKTGTSGGSTISVGNKHKLQQSSSQFSVHYCTDQSSKKMSTSEGTSSKLLNSVSTNPPESKVPASSSSASSVTSTKRRNPDGSLSCNHCGDSDSRKRKRTLSASRLLTNAAKKPRRWAATHSCWNAVIYW